MKVAYLISANGNYAHLRRLLLALGDRGRAHFYIHIDAKAPMPDNLGDLPDVTFVKRIPVWWGGFSQVAATLEMMRRAAEEGYGHYVFISGTDYPIKPVEMLYGKLGEGGEYIFAHRGFSPHKNEKRVSRYWFEGFDRRSRSLRRLFLKSFEKLLAKFARKRRYPFAEAWTGGQWWALSHGCVTFILDYVERNPRYAKFFRTAFCSDEIFFQTLVAISPFAKNVHPGLTYTDWSEGKSGPATICERHLPLFAPIDGKWPTQTAQMFFARKFDDRGGELCAEIDAFCGRN
jgi:hypothetical protein